MIRAPHRTTSSLAAKAALCVLLARTAALAASDVGHAAAPDVKPFAQMSLDFFEPQPPAVTLPVFPAAPILQIPLTPHARNAQWHERSIGVVHALPPVVLRALATGDPRQVYALYGKIWDSVLPRGDDALKRVYVEGRTLVRADRLAARQQRTGDGTGNGATRINYDLFRQALSDAPDIQEQDTFADTARKRRALAQAGYTRLYAEGGSYIALEDADAALIGIVFRKTADAARRRRAKPLARP